MMQGPARLYRRSPRPLRLVVLAILAACDAPAGTGAGSATIAVEPVSLTLAPDVSTTLSARVVDDRGQTLDVPVTWSSDAPDVATVDGGRVTGVAPGTAVITASALAASGSAAVSVVQPLGLRFPLVGTLNRDFYVVNYVDLDASAGIRDHACGIKTYDGHQGTDITLRNFAEMDSGVTIVAAAAGTVETTHDGEYDRNKTWLPGEGFGNYVVVDHRDGFRTIYGHMRKGSVAVTPGQQVAAGTPLGLVGSAGRSDHPHLHFQLAEGSRVVDPYAGDCGPLFTHWADPEPYQDSLHLIDHGVTTEALTLDLVKDPPPPADTVRQASGTVYAWVQIHNLRAGSTSTFRFVRPDGTTYATVAINHDTFYSMSWWWAYVSTAGMTQAGTWTVQYDNPPLSTRTTFVVAPATTTSASAPQTATRAPQTAGSGGGGLARPRPLY